MAGSRRSRCSTSEVSGEGRNVSALPTMSHVLGSLEATSKIVPPAPRIRGSTMSSMRRDGQDWTTVARYVVKTVESAWMLMKRGRQKVRWSSQCSRSVFLPIGTSALGRQKVRGRKRVPHPAARMSPAISTAGSVPEELDELFEELCVEGCPHL